MEKIQSPDTTPELPTIADVQNVFKANAEAFGGTYTDANKLSDSLSQDVIGLVGHIYDEQKNLVRIINCDFKGDGGLPTMEYLRPGKDGAPDELEAVLIFSEGEWKVE